MTLDLTIDTNILMHACNPTQDSQKACLTILNKIRTEDDHYLVLDEGFNICEAKNRSAIYSEYLKRLNSQPLLSMFLRYVAANKKISIVSKKVEPQTSRFINQNVTDKTDRVFVKVAANTISKFLISHDVSDISDDARKRLSKKLGVRVCTANQFSTQP